MIKRLFAAAMLMAAALQLAAVPAQPGLRKITQPNGTEITIEMRGDERIKWILSADGYTLMRNAQGVLEYAVADAEGRLAPSGIEASDAATRGQKERDLLAATPRGLFYNEDQVRDMLSIWEIKDAEATRDFPTTGQRKLVCLLMGFADRPFTKTQADFNNLFNQVGYSANGATGSVKDYYLENSWGQFDLTVDIFGPYTANNTMAYYGGNDYAGNDQNPRALVQEALLAADPDADFSEYDNDGDGAVDGVYLIFAGYGEETGWGGNAIWSHAWTLASPLTLDGVQASRYSCSPELSGTSGSTLCAIGTICHEFGHVLGAPDFYDTDYTAGGQFDGTGDWDMMANGTWNNNGRTPAHHNAYTKVMVYNWATATTIANPQTISVSPVIDAPQFYRVNSTTANEYWLLENRQKTSFDGQIPGHGLVIYHVHASAPYAYSNNLNATHPQRMYVVSANASQATPGSSASSYGSINTSSCPFPGTQNKTQFTDATTPAMLSWAGASTNSPITNISEAGGVVTFDFKGGSSTSCAAPTALTATLNGNSAVLSWQHAGAKGGREVLYSEDFEAISPNALPAGWSVIDADGDGSNWRCVNQATVPGHSGQGHMSSDSYNIIPLTPDNYLVLPQLPAGATTLRYFVAAQDAAYPAEHYSVLASVSGTAAADFTTVLHEETMTAKGAKAARGQQRGAMDQGTWYERNITIPAGTRYVAFRHFDCTDMFRLNIDDVEILGGGGGGGASDVVFNVYRNNALVASAIEANTYTCVDLTVGTHNFHVTAVCPEGESAPSATASVTLTAYAANFTVKDAANAPVQGATVSAGGQTATTNASGVASLNLINGTYNYTVGKPGYNDATGTVTVNGAAANVTVIMTVPGSEPCNAPSGLTATANGASVALAWTAPASGSMATITLEAHDVWGDNTGYQILLDADCATYSQYATGNLSCGTSYAAWEYKLPANAMSNDTYAVVNGIESIEIPAGTYDYLVVNPSCASYNTLYVAADQCDASRGNSVTFEAGIEYHFVLTMQGQNDCVTITESPAKGTASGELYNVYRNNTLIASDVATTSYTDANLAAGTYSYHVAQVCADGESDASNTATATVAAVGIDAPSAAGLRLYPNPASGALRVDFDGDYSRLEVVDLLGRALLSIPVAGRAATVDVSGLPQGVHYLRLTGDAGTAVGRFVKE